MVAQAALPAGTGIQTVTLWPFSERPMEAAIPAIPAPTMTISKGGMAGVLWI